MTYITNTTDAASTTNTSQRTKKNNDELGKDEFLNLLITQLRYQDPMSPMEDKEFIAQMAQFSSLEQMKNLTTSMSTMQATGMIGAEVYWTDDNGIPYAGIVKSVSIVSGEPKLQINDTAVEITKLTKHDKYTKPEDLVGSEVSWTDTASGTELSGAVTATKVVDGKTYVVIAGPKVDLDKITQVQRPSTTA